MHIQSSNHPHLVYMMKHDKKNRALVRMMIILTASAGIVLSAFASLTCEFLFFQSTGILEMDDPFDGAKEGWVGIFQYQILEHEDDERVSDGCTMYDQKFTNAPSKALVAAQFCAVLAPSIAAIAILIQAWESIRSQAFYGSFLTANILLLTSAFVQTGTFAVFAEPDFCFNGCDIGSAVYFSAFSAFAFFLSCILFCCSPRSEPSFQLCSRRGERNYKEEAIDAPDELILPSVITSNHSYSVDIKH